ncbi:MAG: HAD family hydrolase [Candidatus Electrothrix sp. YB6]
MRKNTLHSQNKAVAVDLDGTLVHTVPGEYTIPGRSGNCYLSHRAVELLAEISRTLPTFITTGRNAASVQKIIRHLEKVRFVGFILENGFVVKKDLRSPDPRKEKWKFADKVPPDWEPIPGYERSAGFILPRGQKNPAELVRNLLKETREQGYIHLNQPKIFVYPQEPDKMQGLAEFNVRPHIALGNDINDTQLMQASTYPVTLQAAHSSIKKIAEKKDGYCSPFADHAAAEDMLRWACTKLSALSSSS